MTSTLLRSPARIWDPFALATARHASATLAPWLQSWLRSPSYGTVQKPRPHWSHPRSGRSRTPQNPQANIWKASWPEPGG